MLILNREQINSTSLIGLCRELEHIKLHGAICALHGIHHRQAGKSIRTSLQADFVRIIILSYVEKQTVQAYHPKSRVYSILCTSMDCKFKLTLTGKIFLLTSRYPRTHGNCNTWTVTVEAAQVQFGSCFVGTESASNSKEDLFPVQPPTAGKRARVYRRATELKRSKQSPFWFILKKRCSVPHDLERVIEQKKSLRMLSERDNLEVSDRTTSLSIINYILLSNFLLSIQTRRFALIELFTYSARELRVEMSHSTFSLQK